MWMCVYMYTCMYVQYMVHAVVCACMNMYTQHCVIHLCQFGLHDCILLCTPSGLNLQTTNAILQTNQLLQNWMWLQYPNLGTDFALAGQQLS